MRAAAPAAGQRLGQAAAQATPGRVRPKSSAHARGGFAARRGASRRCWLGFRRRGRAPQPTSSSSSRPQARRPWRAPPARRGARRAPARPPSAGRSRMQSWSPGQRSSATQRRQHAAAWARTRQPACVGACGRRRYAARRAAAQVQCQRRFGGASRAEARAAAVSQPHLSRGHRERHDAANAAGSGAAAGTSGCAPPARVGLAPLSWPRPQRVRPAALLWFRPDELRAAGERGRAGAASAAR